MAAKPKFDPNAAFKTIIGATEEPEQKGGHSPELPAAPEKEASAVDSVIVSKSKEETRSKRVNLVVKPSVYDMAKKKCNYMGISLNECINQFLEAWSKE